MAIETMITTIQDVPSTMSAAQIAFFKFTRRYVMHARDLARSGQKDAARDWHRYFTNAQVVKILSPHNAAPDSNASELAQEISELGGECHPLDVPDWTTDIQAIRKCLEIIVENLPQKNLKPKTVILPSSRKNSYEFLISQRDRTMRRNRR
jgi:hypothetical protein